MRKRPYGPRAWLIDEIDSPVGWAAGLDAMDVAGIVEIIPAERTVVVRSAPAHHGDVAAAVDRVVSVPTIDGIEPPLVIDVIYDGPDLDALADAAGLDVEDVVELHAAGTYHVAFCGFSPGFGYLRGLDRRLHLPRRDTPRTSVPAGSVGLAAGYTCVYPSPSPGGWHLIGHATAELWDVERDPPALLRPGRAVRFQSVES